MGQDVLCGPGGDNGPYFEIEFLYGKGCLYLLFIFFKSILKALSAMLSMTPSSLHVPKPPYALAKVSMNYIHPNHNILPLTLCGKKKSISPLLLTHSCALITGTSLHSLNERPHMHAKILPLLARRSLGKWTRRKVASSATVSMVTPLTPPPVTSPHPRSPPRWMYLQWGTFVGR